MAYIIGGDLSSPNVFEKCPSVLWSLQQTHDCELCSRGKESVELLDCGQQALNDNTLLWFICI